jgi:hypothetical protein
MIFSKFAKVTMKMIKHLTKIQELHIEPYDARSWVALHGTGSQMTF